jgi:hypothetical protein
MTEPAREIRVLALDDELRSDIMDLRLAPTSSDEEVAPEVEVDPKDSSVTEGVKTSASSTSSEGPVQSPAGEDEPPVAISSETTLPPELTSLTTTPTPPGFPEPPAQG